MNKRTIRNLSLLSVGGVILGIVCLVISAMSAHWVSTVDSTGTTVITATSGGNPGFTILGILLLAVAGIVSLIAWIGGIVRVVQLQRWGWLICMIVFGSFATLIYGFAGPETPNSPNPQQPMYPPQAIPMS